MSELSGKTSVQEGMMDRDWRVTPTWMVDGSGYWATRQGKMRELSGKTSMQVGMMDSDGWVAPTITAPFIIYE